MVLDSKAQARFVLAAEQSQLDLFGGGANSPKSKETVDPEEETEIVKTDYFSVKHFQHLVKSEKELAALAEYLLKQKEVAIRFEKEGNSVDAELTGIAFSYFDEESFFIPIEGSADSVKKYLKPLMPLFTGNKYYSDRS